MLGVQLGGGGSPCFLVWLAVQKEDMTCVKIRYAEVLVARGKRGFAEGKQSDAALRSSLSRSERGGSSSALRC